MSNKMLGAGYSGFVQRATLKANPDVLRAVKTIYKKKLETQSTLFIHEINILKQLDHPNVLKFYELYEDEQFFHLVTDLCLGGEMQKRIEDGEFTEQTAEITFKQILEGVCYLHSQQIVHRDLKPANILYIQPFPSQELQIIDYGFSTNSKSISSERIGTPYFMSPEIIKGSSGEQCDLWSIGVMLYYTISQCYPFNGKDNEQLFSQIEHRTLVFVEEIWDDVSADCKDLITKLLEKDPKKRITAKQALLHQWFHGANKYKRKSLGKVNVNIKNENLSSLLKKNALNILASFMSQKEIQEINEAFKTFDQGNLGYITSHDFKEALKCTQNPEALSHFQNLFSKHSNHSDKIYYSEFVELALDHSKYFSEVNLKNLFKVYDVEGRGRVNKDNLKEIMQRQGREMTDEEVEQWMSQFDIQHKGFFNFQEFCQIMQDEKI